MANSEELSTFTHLRITKSQDPFPEKLRCLKAVAWKNSIIVLGGFAYFRDEVTHDPGSVCYFHCSGKWLRNKRAMGIAFLIKSLPQVWLGLIPSCFEKYNIPVFVLDKLMVMACARTP